MPGRPFAGVGLDRLRGAVRIAISRILALETGGSAGSIALWHDGKIALEVELDPARRNAQTLAPTLQEALAAAGWRPRDVQLVAVAVGPGSFTGLRVGVTTAKLFAYAVGAKIIGVVTPDAIAWPARDLAAERLRVLIDAQRGDFFVADYVRSSETSGKPAWHRNGPVRILSRTEVLDSPSLAGCGLSGPAVAPLAEAALTQGAVLASETLRVAQAASVAHLAALRAETNDFDELQRLVPLYVRRSAAEEKIADAPPSVAP